jgi:hypothetical protein
MSNLYVDGKEVVDSTVYEYGHIVNEHVDYEILVDLKRYSDGTISAEILDQLLVILDDEGTKVNSFEVVLPKQYIEDALKEAREYYE